MEIETVNIDGCLSVRTIFKTAINPDGRGRGYLGSITLPYRDFSYVIKVQSSEQGMTGMREAIVAERLMASGSMQLDQEVFDGPAGGTPDFLHSHDRTIAST